MIMVFINFVYCFLLFLTSLGSMLYNRFVTHLKDQIMVLTCEYFSRNKITGNMTQALLLIEQKFAWAKNVQMLHDPLSPFPLFFLELLMERLSLCQNLWIRPCKPHKSCMFLKCCVCHMVKLFKSSR